MALSKIGSDAIVNDSIGPTQLDETANYTFTGTVAGAGGVNTPAFGARATVNQTGLTNGSWTKIQFDTALFNIGSGYDTVNDKFVVPSGEGGKYFLTATAKINANSYNLMGTGIRFTVNGSASLEEIHFLNNVSGYTSYSEGKNCNGILNLSAGDEVEVYAYYQHVSGTAGTITGSGGSGEIDTFFYGYKIIE